jgi:hypothetical protein
LLGGLVWISPSPITRRTDSLRGPPTWSWASTSLGSDGNKQPSSTEDVCCCRYEGPLSGKCAEVVDFQVVNENGDIFGQVISASLELKGSWKHLNDAEDALKPNFIDGRTCGIKFGYRNQRTNFEKKNSHVVMCALDEPPGPHGYSQNSLRAQTIYFVLGEGRSDSWGGRGLLRALILEPVEESEKTYRRIGLASISKYNEKVAEWPVKSVVII